MEGPSTTTTAPLATSTTSSPATTTASNPTQAQPTPRTPTAAAATAMVNMDISTTNSSNRHNPNPNLGPKGSKTGTTPKNRSFPKPIHMKNFLKNCHDSIAIVQEAYLNHLYSQERHSATQEVDTAATEHDYVKSLLQISNPISKFLYSALEERLNDIAYRSDKDDPSMRDDHVTRLYQEANINALVGPMIHTLAETHGNSPTPSQQVSKHSACTNVLSSWAS